MQLVENRGWLLGFNSEFVGEVVVACLFILLTTLLLDDESFIILINNCDGKPTI